MFTTRGKFVAHMWAVLFCTRICIQSLNFIPNLLQSLFFDRFLLNAEKGSSFSSLPETLLFGQRAPTIPHLSLCQEWYLRHAIVYRNLLHRCGRNTCDLTDYIVVVRTINQLTVMDKVDEVGVILVTELFLATHSRMKVSRRGKRV